MDGKQIGSTPVDPLRLEAGTYQFSVSSEGHFEWQEDVEVEGFGRSQVVRVELSSKRADLEVSAQPPGARLLVDGQDVGQAPAEIPLLAGTHSLELRLEGYVSHRQVFEIEAGDTLKLGPVGLAEAPAQIRVVSEPAGAMVRVAGEFRGQTPLTLALDPGAAVEIEATRAGYEPARTRVTPTRGEAREVQLELIEILAQVRVRPSPESAQVFVAGELRGTGAQVVAVPVSQVTEIAVRLEGYKPETRRVNPKSRESVQELDVRLVSLEEVALQEKKAREPKPVITTSLGQSLVLLGGGTLQMGASRREPGRRANETVRSARLERRFYLATHEVTNADFQAFRAAHSSGTAGGHDLAGGKLPVVRVTWEDAILFCNWLSEKDGLTPVYVESSEGYAAKSPVPDGYRLPTEVEWAWAARYEAGRRAAAGAGGAEALKYPWGAALPVPAGAGNYADQASGALLARTLEGYSDGYAATAPVGSFPPNGLGIFDLGGNVAEWVHDRYAIGAASSQADADPTGTLEWRVVRDSRVELEKCFDHRAETQLS